MKGDFTRFTHNPDKQYNRVLKQQGRVALDADWNEHVSIQSYLQRTEAADIIGCCGVPDEGNGFDVRATVTREGGGIKVLEERTWGDSLSIAPGRIYVDGLLCENTPVHGGQTEGEVRLITDQDQYPTFELPEEKGLYVVYLDVWERHITALEDDSIKEVALGGPDTTTRVQTVWQAKMEKYEGERCPPCNWKARTHEPRLSAWADPSETQDNLCEMPEAGGYRGIDNRLYRVEIHEGGAAEDATFKWSRDNGAVVYPVEAVRNDGEKIVLAKEPKDRTLAIQAGDWIEFTWEEQELGQEPGILKQVAKISGEASRTVELDSAVSEVPDPDQGSHLKVRRWNHRANGYSLSGGAIELQEDVDLSLEEGVYIRFEEDGGMYQTGDYWTIPARSILEDVLWSTTSNGHTGENGEPLFRPREGIEHHYCPLGLVKVKRDTDNEQETAYRVVRDCRRAFPSLTEVKKTCCRAVDPEDDLRRAIDEVIEAGGGCISLCEGLYQIEAPLKLSGARNLRIHGMGQATILHLKDTSETARARGGILLQNCHNVTLENMLLIGEDVPAVITTVSEETENISRGINVVDVTALHRDLVELEERDATIRPAHPASSALELAGAADIQVTNSRLLAPVGIQSLFGEHLPDPSAAPVQEEPDEEKHSIDFEDQSWEASFPDEGFTSNSTSITVSRSSITVSRSGEHSETVAILDESGDHIGIRCIGTRLDINFLQNFGGSAVGLSIRVENQAPQKEYELRVNGESMIVEESVTEFDGMSIGGVDISVVQEDEERETGQIISFSGNVYTLGIGGTNLFIDDLHFQIQSIRISVAYGEGVHGVRVNDSSIHFSQHGIFSCRSEEWTVDSSNLIQFSSNWLDEEIELPEQFASLPETARLFETLEALTGYQSGELPPVGSAVTSFLWRDSTIENCHLHSNRGYDGWWQIRGSVTDNTIYARRRGLHAFWLHDADWRNNIIEGEESLALSFAGSYRGRIAENRIDSTTGLANESFADIVQDLDGFIVSTRRAYRLPDSDRWRILWILLEDSVRLMNLRTVVWVVKYLAISWYISYGLYGEEGGLHADLVHYPVLYALAKRLMPWADGKMEIHGDKRPFPLFNVEICKNQMECGEDAIDLEDFVTAGGIEIADNQLHAGLRVNSGQTVRLNALPLSVNVHLMNLLIARFRALTKSFMEDVLGIEWKLPPLTPLSAPTRIRDNTVNSLNTAIESNLFDLDILGNHITLRERPETNEEVKEGFSIMEKETKSRDFTPVVTAARDGSVSALNFANATFKREYSYTHEANVRASDVNPSTASLSFPERLWEAQADMPEARGYEAGLEKITDECKRVTNTYGIWVKGPGCAIKSNDILVAPGVEEARQPRGGIRLEAEEETLRSNQLLSQEGTLDPLLGVTETVIVSNDIIGGIGYGIDVCELFGGIKRLANDHQEKVEELGLCDLKIRQNEIRGFGEGGVIIRDTARAVNVDIVENAITGCGNNRVLGDQGTSNYFWAEYGLPFIEYGGIIAQYVGLCRVARNEIIDSAHLPKAFGIGISAGVQLSINGNSVTKCGPSPSDGKLPVGGGIAILHVTGQSEISHNEVLYNRPQSLIFIEKTLHGHHPAQVVWTQVRYQLNISPQNIGKSQAVISDNRIHAQIYGSEETESMLVVRVMTDQLLFKGNTCRGSVRSPFWPVMIRADDNLTVSDNLFDPVNQNPALYIDALPESSDDQKNVIILGNMGANGAKILVPEGRLDDIDNDFNQPSVEEINN